MKAEHAGSLLELATTKCSSVKYDVEIVEEYFARQVYSFWLNHDRIWLLPQAFAIANQSISWVFLRSHHSVPLTVPPSCNSMRFLVCSPSTPWMLPSPRSRSLWTSIFLRWLPRPILISHLRSPRTCFRPHCSSLTPTRHSRGRMVCLPGGGGYG